MIDQSGLVLVSGWRDLRLAARQLQERLDYHMSLTPARALVPDDLWSAMLEHATSSAVYALPSLGRVEVRT